MELRCSAKVRYLVPFITESTLTGAITEQGAEGHIVTWEKGESGEDCWWGASWFYSSPNNIRLAKEWETDGRGALWGENKKYIQIWI